jgi:hypothetical protein
MKTEPENKKEFHSVLYFRRIKEQISKELEGKTFQEQKEFIRKVLAGEIKLTFSV